MGTVTITANKADLDLLDKLGETGLTSQEVADAIVKSNGIQSSASEIDGIVNKFPTAEIKKQSNYIKKIREFKSLVGVSIVSDSSSLFAIEHTLNNTLKIKSNNSTTLARILIDLSSYGEGFNVNEKKDLGLKIKVTGFDKLSYMNVNLWATSSPSQGYNNTTIQAPSKIFADGIYNIPLHDKDFAVYVGSPATLPMKFLRLEILPLATNSTGTPLEIEILEVIKFKPKKSKCMISFDDGHNTCIQIAQLLKDRNLRATFYIYNQGISQSGNLTLAQLQQIYEDGHDIAVHNNIHSSFNTLGEEAYFSGQLECRDWIRTNVGYSAENHAAFVGGQSSQALIERMEKAGFKSLRRATPSAQFVHSGWGTEIDNKWYNPRFRGNVYEMNNTQTIQVIKDAHQYAIDHNQDFFVYGHQLQAVETAQAWNTVAGSDYCMADYFDWIKSKVDDGSIEVLTVSQFWKEFE